MISDVLGMSARAMLAALIAGQRDAMVLAELAQTRMRPQIADLRLALEGGFDEHHALMLRLHLEHVDAALRSALCESAWVASRTNGYLGSLYRQLHRAVRQEG